MKELDYLELTIKFTEMEIRQVKNHTKYALW